MAAYHIVLVHFPIALWTTAALAILIRALSDSPFAKACDRVLVPLLVLGIAGGVAAYVVGLLVWPWDALASSPLGRNHMLAATWSLAYWTLVAVVRWRAGDAIWNGAGRWIMLGLAGLGTGLLTIAGTLGGHLSGTATLVSQMLRLLGWEVYTTFYVPDFTLVVILVAAVVLVAIGFWSGRTTERSAT
jgi:hypothetical protein